jgi:hypothetical protein
MQCGRHSDGHLVDLAHIEHDMANEADANTVGVKSETRRSSNAAGRASASTAARTFNYFLTK